jgi:colanic acid biosynthesis glycosyl transferase WcaI
VTPTPKAVSAVTEAKAPGPLKRVAIYGINYAPELTGVGRYTGEIGGHFAALGHEVCVITAPPHYPSWGVGEGYSNRRWAKETVAGAVVYRCPLYLHPRMTGVRRLIAPLTFALSSAPVAFWQIVKRRPAVVIIVEPTLFAAPIGLLAAKLVGAATVLHVQDLEVEAAFAVGHLKPSGLLERLAAAFDTMTTRAFDRIITISQRMAEKIVAKSVERSKVHVIRNWIDLQLIQPIEQPSPYRAELGLTGQFVVLYAGALGKKQGVDLLIKTAALLAGRPDIIFVVAGDGPLRPALEAASSALPALRLLPFQSEDRMRDFLGLADVHLLPQERGAADLLLPSKIGGMLASGRRILATADPGTELAEFLGDCCDIVPPGDPRILAQALERIADGQDLRKGEAARLERAETLSKAEAIEKFTHAVLLSRPAPASPAAEQAEEALG